MSFPYHLLSQGVGGGNDPGVLGRGQPLFAVRLNNGDDTLLRVDMRNESARRANRILSCRRKSIKLASRQMRGRGCERLDVAVRQNAGMACG